MKTRCVCVCLGVWGGGGQGQLIRWTQGTIWSWSVDLLPTTARAAGWISRLDQPVGCVVVLSSGQLTFLAPPSTEGSAHFAGVLPDWPVFNGILFCFQTRLMS